MRLWPFHFVRSKPTLPLMFLNFKTLYFQTFQEKRIGSISQFPFHYFFVLMQVLLISKSEGKSRYISFELFQYLFGRFLYLLQFGSFCLLSLSLCLFGKTAGGKQASKNIFQSKKKGSEKGNLQFFSLCNIKKIIHIHPNFLRKICPTIHLVTFGDSG